MTTGHVFIATSLDGFVARPDHRLDWLLKRDSTGEDHGYDRFIAGMDGLVMGRTSFEKVLSFDPWPYSLPVTVMSRSLDQASIPEPLRDSVQLSRQTPEDLMHSLGERGCRRVYVDGGLLVQSFLRAGLIAEMTVTLIPVLIGEGRRLFGPTDRDIDLELVDTRRFASGMVQIHYRVAA